jgi:high-affinity iron transporter
VVLFLYGIIAQGGASAATMTAGGALGLLAGAGISAMIFFGLLTIPAGKLFQVTSGLITLLAAGMAAQAVLYLQNGGYIDVLGASLWNSSWLLADDSIGGRLLHTLVGYVQEPDGAQLLAYGLTVALMLVLMRTVSSRQSPPRPA